MDILINFAYLGLMAVFICSVWFVLLRVMDVAAKVAFREALNKIERNPMACAVYFGARLVATSMLLAPLLRVII